jgi:CRISPR/Cas system-associated exonuclease Cas4 (RecB family)
MPKKRLQSPSSINTFNQCPRKYFYRYILKLPTKTSIQLIRGKIAHSVLEDFFDANVSNLTNETAEPYLRQSLQDLLMNHWQKQESEIQEFNLNPDQEKFYFAETMMMLLNWFQQFMTKVEQHQGTFQEVFKKLTPIREQRYVSEEHYVQGFIDAIEDIDGRVHVTDYKTSTNLKISDDYRLQLGIYALLYNEKHGRLPNQTSVYFLRHKPKYVAVDDDLLESVAKSIEFVHTNTKSDNIDDYPLKPNNLCKWCDFHTICFEQTTIKDFQEQPDQPVPKPQQR